MLRLLFGLFAARDKKSQIKSENRDQGQTPGSHPTPPTAGDIKDQMLPGSAAAAAAVGLVVSFSS